jgi:hypothetical protein
MPGQDLKELQHKPVWFGRYFATVHKRPGIRPDYPLSGILTELVVPEPATFNPLAVKLAAWRDDLRKVSR